MFHLMMNTFNGNRFVVCVLIWIFLFLHVVSSEKGPCNSYFNGCCPGTKWDWDENNCAECEPGYFWINCTKICPYPTFGKSCAQTCSCTNTSCDFANGCKNGK
ncbi:uncharacterized protein LOC144620138 [Crassostrea virginica]